MEVRELRIGNYVSDNFASDSFFAQVKKLDFTRCHYGNFHSCYSDLKPIPITEKTLKLNDEFWEFIGFGTRLIYQHKEFKAIKIEYSNDNDCFIYFNDNLINLKKFVHEAQNLFHSLTGKELELKQWTYSQT